MDRPHRLLEANSTATADEFNDTDVLRDTAVLYGSVLLVLWLVFCWVRLQFPRPFTIRQWTMRKELKTVMADNQFGFISWMWLLNDYSDDDILEQCGMDALCFLKVLSMGSKICLMGVFNSIWLLPLYGTAKGSVETATIDDAIVGVTVAHVPSESPRLVGTALAAYMLFGFTMYLIYTDFKWFTEMRHKYLQQKKPRNYSAYVRNIPEAYRTNKKLKRFFQDCLSEDAVVETNIKVQASNVSKLIQMRTAVVANLENAVAVSEATGEPPKHKRKFKDSRGAEEIDSIESYTLDLKALNSGIRKRIKAMEKKMARTPLDLESIGPASPAEASVGDSAVSSTEKHRANELAEQANAKRSDSEKNADGTYFSGGWVTFSSLSRANAALQMLHYREPFGMEVSQAPDPVDIFWANVGREHADLQFGKLFSLTATVTICLLWTIPMTFFSTLSSIEGLKQEFAWVEDAIEAFPPLGPILEQAAPFFVIIFNALLPIILEALSMFEGPVSAAVVQSSTFSKLAAFMIIQTFFVSALGGELLNKLEDLAESPFDAIDLLANSLPAQSTYFMQIVFVKTVLGFAMENLRIVALVTALLRKCIGPRLTEKQRQTTFFGIRPLADPTPFMHASNMALICVFFFMVVLVYQVIAPITSYCVGLCFVLLRVAFLHQFVYIYPTNPDSGGMIWLNFIRILQTCMLIAEFTIIGLMGLKKASIATPLMFPLLIGTMLFNSYIRQEHFHTAMYLPSQECTAAEPEKKKDLSFLKRAFLQEELVKDNVVPTDIPEEMAVTFLSANPHAFV